MSTSIKSTIRRLIKATNKDSKAVSLVTGQPISINWNVKGGK